MATNSKAGLAGPIDRSKPPNVHVKGIQEVVLLKYRESWQRGDVLPFFVLYAAVLAKAVFHAVNFQWTIFTYSCYALGGCAVLHVLAFLFTHWSVSFKTWASCSKLQNVEDAEAVLVIPEKFAGSMELIKVDWKTLRDGLNETDEISFDFRKQRVIYNRDTHTWEKLKYPVKESFDWYLKCSGYGSDAKAMSTLDKYGMNKFEVPLPPFMELLKEHLLAPFFCFQVFCVLLWMLDEYWYYSLFTLFMLVTFECTVVQQRLRNLKELRGLQTPKQAIMVYRCGKWEQMPGDSLLPGDLISIGRPTGGANAEEKVVPADCLLLAGTAIVEEAVLTGESTPQWKVPASDADPKEHLNTKVHKNHMLFGGTKILQHTGNKEARVRTPDGGCLAVVVRTGFETAQGRLMRTILFSSERVTANSLEAGLFIAFLLVFALAAAWHVLSEGLADPNRDRFKLILNCIMLITSVIPPELPMELSMAVNASLVALARKRVFCTEPFRIPYAGKVEVCCFDKTGTLTSDHLLLEDVVVEGGSASASAQAAAAAEDEGQAAASDGAQAAASDGATAAGSGSGKHKAGRSKAGKVDPKFSRAHTVMATCHSLAHVGNDLIGDPLEKAALEAVGWHYANDVARSPDRSTTATILVRHHFNSNLKRMSTIVRLEQPGAGAPTYEVVVKGAPEVIKQFLASPPPDYDAMYKRYAAQGARVIALATRLLGSDSDASLDVASLKSRPRDEVESQLTWAGFAIFSCPLKEESEPALRALRDSSHQLVMITGDAPLTACFAASKVHIVTRDVLVLGHKEEEKGQAVHGPAASKAAAAETDDDYQWVSPDESTVIPFSRAFPDLLSVASRYDLAITGDALAYVESVGLAHTVIPLCQVFARVSPEQKELVLVTLKALGRTTLMCGDGTNDVGGLKAAHVGVALLAATDAALKQQQELEALKKKAKEESDKAMADRQLAAAANGSLASPGVPPPPAAAKTNKKKGQGEAMLERVRASGKPVTPAMQKMADWMDKMEADAATGDAPMLKPGDASMASPFTAKASSVMPCTDIIKQGRSSLVTTVQMFKILGLLCLSTAYSLGVMYLQGVKLSDAQATLNGMLTATLFFFISQAKPREQLSRTRPHPSIFTPYFFISLLGQFSVNLGFLIYMYNLALKEMPEGDRLKADSEFKPNLVNSVTYMVEACVSLSTFTVNYMGHPFNNAIRENKTMFNVIKYMSIFLVVVLFDVVPGLGSNFGMVVIPEHIRLQLLALAVASFCFNYALEHGLRVVFPAPIPPEKGYMAYMKGGKAPRAPVLPGREKKTQ